MRALWIALLVVLACVATGAQLDRASRRQPSLAAFVPGPFRSFAQESLTLAIVRSAEPRVALAEARMLVERSPMPAEHLTLLAIAQERSGDRDSSALLIQRAAQRGWRDPIAQQAMFDIALAAGDAGEASRRYAALWALQEEQAPLADMSSRLLATAEGREALATTLVAGGNWTRPYLRSVAGNPDATVVETIGLALRKGAVFDCQTSALLMKALEKQGRPAEIGKLSNCRRPQR